MDILQNKIASGLPSVEQGLRIVIRLLAAAALAGLIGYERESRGKAAGLRTHMLVAIADLSRVVRGVAAGIGFIGAGAILKLTGDREIQGLTTAAGVWMTAAVGVAAGLGEFGLAAVSVALSLIVLAIVARFEASADGGRP